MSRPDPQTCRALNERRQASIVAILADEHEAIGSGVMSHTPGCAWIGKAVGVDLDAPLEAEQAHAIAAWFRATTFM